MGSLWCVVQVTPNPIEKRTSSSQLRFLAVAAHVERQDRALRPGLSTTGGGQAPRVSEQKFAVP